jgi:ATP-binding cassette subfamily F protein 1
VLADETPAVDAVLKADKVRWELVQEEKAINKLLEKNPKTRPNAKELLKIREIRPYIDEIIV